MSTLTKEQKQSIENLLANCHLCTGLGTNKEKACSVAAINLALSNKLTDNIPDCMSDVIGKWIIVIQDAMTENIRNSSEWKNLLPLAAGTGKDKEIEGKRLTILLSEMWKTLEILQPIANKHNFGKEWKKMISAKTHAAADAAARAAAHAADAADAAVRAADAAAHAARAAADAARAAAHASYAAVRAADAARAAAHASYAADNFWYSYNPINILEKLITC